MDKISNENMENMDIREATMPTTEHLAMEILKNEMEKSRAKNIWILAILALAILILVSGTIINIHLANVNQKNNKDWIELFGSYDYVSQDGEGINNINTGSQGDLNSVPASKE